MAVRERPAPKKPAFLPYRLLKGAVILSCLAWFLLFVIGLGFWGVQGFDRAFNKLVQHAMTVSQTMSEFSATPYLQRVTHNFNLFNNPELMAAITKAKGAGSEISHVAQKNAGAWMEQIKLTETQRAPLEAVLDDVTLKGRQFLLLAKACTHVIGIKLAILLSAVPLFLLAMTAGLIDGLNQRAIRTASLGRESTYVFHKSVPFARKVLLWILALWLALPLPIAPSPVFIALSVILSVVVSISASRFKKYL